MNRINIDSVSEQFENHLSIDKNYRIIFSGKFGIGKSYFLNSFFDDRKEKYNKFWISPVNYAISSNEDIFELVKADIIKELFLSGKIDLKKLPEDNTLQKISSFVEKNQFIIGNFLLNTLIKINPSIETPKKIIDEIGKIFKGYKFQIEDNQIKEKTRSEELVEHWGLLSEKLGNIYEYNYITKVINSFLVEIREENKKKNVLIIDDLDRIDPEHIFRILNVLSVHNNHFDEKNKFEFDHIVIVCDIDNIKKIFEHKYGAGVDFDGYIDKFYSVSLFFYSNLHAVKNYVAQIFSVENDDGFFDLVIFVLKSLIDQNLLSLRKLLKHKFEGQNRNVVIEQQNGLLEKGHFSGNGPGFIKNFNHLYISSKDLKILAFLELMTYIYGDINTFMDCVIKLKKTDESVDYKKYELIISFLALQSHIINTYGDDLYFSITRQNGFITSITAPTIKFLNRNFYASLKWKSSNPYDGRESYFKDAEVHESTYNTASVKDYIKVRVIFETLEQLILGADKKKYLNKIDVFYRTAIVISK